MFYSGMTLEDVAEDLVNDGLFGTIPEKILPYFIFELLAHELDTEGYSECDDGVYENSQNAPF